MCWPRPMGCRVRGLIFRASTERISSSLGVIDAIVGECYCDGAIVVLINDALGPLRELMKSEVCTADCNT